MNREESISEIEKEVNREIDNLREGGFFRKNLFSKLCSDVNKGLITLTIVTAAVFGSPKEAYSQDKNIAMIETVKKSTAEIIREVEIAKEYIKAREYARAKKIIDNLKYIDSKLKSDSLDEMIQYLEAFLKETKEKDKQEKINIETDNKENLQFKTISHSRIISEINSSTKPDENGNLIKTVIITTNIKRQDVKKYSKEIENFKSQIKKILGDENILIAEDLSRGIVQLTAKKSTR